MKVKRIQKSGNQAPTKSNGKWSAVLGAFLSTILALPASAGVAIPDDPLTTGNRVAPNILFILDDSGSMAWRYMYNVDLTRITGANGFESGRTGDNRSIDSTYTTTSTTPYAIYDQNYRTNTVYYNPTQNYEPWVQANGNDMAGGTDYASAYSDVNRAVTTTNLGNNLQVFYVPKNLTDSTAAYLGDVRNYYRYHILPTASGGDIVRGEWGSATDTPTSVLVLPAGATVRGNTAITHTVASVAANRILLVSVTSTLRTATYSVRNPSGNEVCAGNVTSQSTATCLIQPTQLGAYTVVVRRQNGANDDTTYSVSASLISSNRCEYPGTGTATDFVNCTTSVRPTGRTVAAEKSNFATWYSYHRTRIKAAKAGAGRAFRAQGNNVRVGYRSLHGNGSADYDIPVGTADGRFIDDSATSVTNRTTWYSRLYNARGANGTPLQAALNDAGNYFSESGAGGPYGPQSGVNQYSCRQNFTILTTDGYWNSGTIDVGNADGTNGSQITNGKPVTDPNYRSYTYTAGSPYSDGRSQTLADVAMYYWKRDLRGNLENNVPSSTGNPAFWQHMVTFGISIGLKGSMGWGSVDDVPANPAWPQPTADNVTTIDDLLHASVNGRGEFVSAMDPSAFAAGLSAALAVIEQRTSSYSNVATNSTTLNTGAQVFSASYTSGVWSGELTAQAVTRAGVSSTVSWRASVPALTNRRVFTFNGTAGTTFPTTAQMNALARSGGPADYPVTGAQNADYIKGDQSREGATLGQLRVRSKILGDIVGSSPFYVKGGPAGDSTTAGTVYVGANDGMLHAFNAANGQELFSYVPGIVNMNSLGTLSRGDYTHKFFVDGPIVVSSRLMTPGQNVLVGALGRGGKGLYALDVSAPGAFAAASVKWERAETTNSNMGMVLGTPILAKVRNGTPVNAVVLGNGPNSTSERAVLVVLDLDTGAVIREIDTGVGSAALPNGLSGPVGIYAADGKTLVYAYAGDLQGNVWKFDLRSTSPAAWTATKLFTATKGAAQPITGGLAVAADPATNKRWVFFGTGRFLTTSDVDDRSTYAQSIYGVQDEDTGYTRSDLTQRTMAVTAATANGYPVRAFEAKSALPAGSKGWYVDLPGAGERIVQDAQIASNFVVTASMIPEGNACEGSGTGYLNALDAFTGTNGGVSFFDLNNDGATDNAAVTGGLPVGSANMGVGMPTRPVLLPGQFVLGGSGNGAAPGLGGGRSFGMTWQRVSWREIRQD